MFEIQQQDVFALDRLLDSGNQDDAAFRRVRLPGPQIELAVVECDGDGIEPQRRGAIDQIACRVGDDVDRVVGRVRVELDFQHLNICSHAAGLRTP